MYTLCSTEAAADQQRRFESVLMTMLTEQPYDSITISELCRRAGYSRRVFYRLFEQKADVIYAAVDQVIMDYEKFNEDPAYAHMSSTARFFIYWKTQKPLLDGLDACNSSTLLIDRCVPHVLRENPQVLRDFGVEESPYGREQMVFFLSGLFGLVLLWYRTGYERTVEEMAQLLVALLSTRPLKVPAEGATLI